MNTVSEVLQIAQQPIQLLAALFLFTMQEQKRKHWLMYGVGVMLGACTFVHLLMECLMLLPAFLRVEFLGSIVWSLGWFAAAAVGVLVVFELPDREMALYITALAYLTQHMAYCVCNAIHPGNGSDRISFETLGDVLGSLILPLVAFTLVYAGVYGCVARPIAKGGINSIGRGKSVVIMLSVLVVSIVFSAAVQNSAQSDAFLFRSCRIYAALCCALMLWGQVDLHNRLTQERETALQKQLWVRHRAQYDRAAASVKLINHKCHALKCQVAELRKIVSTNNIDAEQLMLRQIEDSVSVYDSIVETGNEILDTILTEKSLLCAANNITFTCVADGKAVRFLEAVDLFSLLGNALDNAEEAVRTLEDADKRAISVSIFSGHGVAILQVENFYEGQLTFVDGLPVTTKGDPEYHGFGLKSIRSTAQKYGGAVSVQADNGIFLLRVTLPLDRF